MACVCAAVVRYSLQDTPRTGVCTTYIQDRLLVGEKCPVFISRNPDFRLPSGDVPVIMIGPGTGIAPFRAFIQERCKYSIIMLCFSVSWLIRVSFRENGSGAREHSPPSGALFLQSNKVD